VVANPTDISVVRASSHLIGPNNDEIRMTKLEAITNSTLDYPERSEAESNDAAALSIAMATGFLDFAWNDRAVYSSSDFWASFVIRHSCFVIAA
jgi:hypothetical protein